MSTLRAPRRELLAAPPQDPVRPVWWLVRPVSPGSLTKIQQTLAREGPRQGNHTLGCPRLGRPARAPPHAMEMRDEQHIGLEEKGKKDKMCLIDVIGYSQSAVTLHIYRVGWSIPFRSRNSNKSRVKIQLLTWIGHFRPA